MMNFALLKGVGPENPWFYREDRSRGRMQGHGMSREIASRPQLPHAIPVFAFIYNPKFAFE